MDQLKLNKETLINIMQMFHNGEVTSDNKETYMNYIDEYMKYNKKEFDTVRDQVINSVSYKMKDIFKDYVSNNTEIDEVKQALVEVYGSSEPIEFDINLNKNLDYYYGDIGYEYYVELLTFYQEISDYILDNSLDLE
jgi:histidyl-tRNA synthetase